MTVSILHNPRCGTSRKVLAMIRERGVEPVIVAYLETPLDRAQLRALAAEMGGVRALLREKEGKFTQLGLADATLNDDALIDAIVAHPILLNRPIVRTPKGTRLCRPPEAVTELL